MALSIPDDERLFIDLSREDRTVMTGIRVVLEPDSVVAGRNLIVRATDVEIYGHIKVPGGVVDLFAQRIIARPDAVIDVSGGVGAPDFVGSAPALSGLNPGDAGNPGKNGGDGEHAGQIDIVCESITGTLQLLANGGNGGAAQSGGNGIVGAAGAAMRECNPPTGGMPGGNAGQAGRPGKGGNGGKVNVTVFTPPGPDQIQVSVVSGQAGAPGKHGEPGAGGAGGGGGSHGSWVKEPCVV